MCDRYLRGLTGHVARPSRSIANFGFRKAEWNFETGLRMTDMTDCGGDEVSS